MVCGRCNKNPGTERTVTKPSGEVKRVLCDACATATNDVYPVQGIRQPVPEPEQPEIKEDEPPAAKSTHKRRGG